MSNTEWDVKVRRTISKFDRSVTTAARRQFKEAGRHLGALRQLVGIEDPRNMKTEGYLGILDKDLIGFFCSVRCPGDIVLRTYDLARALRMSEVTVVGGFQSPMEKELLSLLLRGTAPIVICPARGLDRMRVPAEWKKPIADGRLLLISFFPDNIVRTTESIAATRNTYVATLADRILIAHAERGGKTEQLCRISILDGKQVFALNSLDNRHLFDLGAIPIEANDPGRLIVF